MHMSFFKLRLANFIEGLPRLTFVHNQAYDSWVEYSSSHGTNGIPSILLCVYVQDFHWCTTTRFMVTCCMITIMSHVVYFNLA